MFAVSYVLSCVFSAASVSVPKIPSPTFDGLAKEEEYAGAFKAEYGNSKLFLGHDGEKLYIGIQTARMGIASISVEQKDGFIKILHASAAIGTATYRKSDEKYKATKSFVWSCRENPDAKKLDKERTDFFTKELWMANARTKPDGFAFDREFVISLKMVEGAKLAIAYDTIIDANLHIAFPKEATFDQDQIQIVRGFTDKAVIFPLATWTTLEIKP